MTTYTLSGDVRPEPSGGSTTLIEPTTVEMIVPDAIDAIIFDPDGTGSRGAFAAGHRLCRTRRRGVERGHAAHPRGGSGGDDLRGGAGNEGFAFAKNASRDTVTDFINKRDTLVLNDNLRNPNLSVSEVLDRCAHQVDGDVVLDFGNEGTLTVEGITIQALKQNAKDLNPLTLPEIRDFNA